MKISLTKAAGIMQGQLIGPESSFDAVGTDTRLLNKGDLFFAIKGENFNGEAFVERAFSQGACAAVLTQQQDDLVGAQIIVDDVVIAFGRLANYKREQQQAKVVAITGSCGKTSVKGMLKSILAFSGVTHATHANFNNHIGVPLTIFSCADNVDFLVVEAGTSNPGEIGYLSQIIDPDVAVVTNVHPAHIQGFGSLDAIAREKSTIYTAGDRTPKMVMNRNLIHYAAFKQCDVNNSAIVFGPFNSDEECKSGNQLLAKNQILDNSGCASFELTVKGKSISVLLNVPGMHQVENALAAAGCAIALDIDLEKIVLGLQAYTGDKGRMQVHALKQGELIDDSYNANPASMKAAIDLLASKKNSLLVVGDMGELGAGAEKIHQDIGKYAATSGIGQLVSVGAFADDYCDGFGKRAKKFITHEEVVAYVNEQMSEDVTVLVKGSRFTKMDRVCRGLLSLGGEG